MEFAFYFLFFIAGAFIGSFLNVVVDRYVTKESILIGRSRCDSCKTTLVAKDLVPIFSFLSLKGRCRYCEKRLSYYYLVAEILTGAMFVLIAIYSGVLKQVSVFSWISFLYYAVVISVYIVIFLSDIKYRIIPNRAVFFGVVFVLVFILSTIGYSAITSYTRLKNDEFGRYLLEVGYWRGVYFQVLINFLIRIGSAIGIALFFAFLIFITKGRGMGWGDVKLAILIGVFNGFPINIVAVFLGFLLGALYSVILVAAKRKTVKDTIPFGPFLVLGSTFAYAYGNTLLNWYINLFS